MASTGGGPRLQILGPLRIWRDGVELDAGPRQQAYLLAVLLAQAGRPTSMSELVDLVWADDVPVSATNILQKYVGALRRLLEPALPARATGSYLQRHGSGYLLAADPDRLDVAKFRELVAAARPRAEERPDATLDVYVRALGLWHGAAGDGLAHGPTGMSIFAALDAEFLDLCVTAADLAVARGQPGRVIQSLRLAARMAPLHEGVHASLAITLAEAGQPAEALSSLRTVRARLADELGIDPGPVLVAAYRRVLEKAPDAEPPVQQSRPAAVSPRSSHLIGRADDIAVLRRTVEAALAGSTGLGLVAGEPGVGKTRLLEEIAAEADRRGLLVAWGRCLEGDVAPSLWPWVEAVGAVVDALPAAERDQYGANALGPLLGPSAGDPAIPMPLPHSGSRFRLFEQAVAIVGQVSLRRPVVLLVDDLQWADTASLDLFSHLIARQPSGTAVIAALRDCAPTPGPELRRMLAAASRLPVHRRIRLGPLDASEVAELVRRETGRHPSSGVTHHILARSGGNPFFVRELSRLLAADDVRPEVGAARIGVPATVHDVVHGRITGLADEAQSLLRLAALIGRDFEIPLLAGSAGLDVETCHSRLASMEGLGLVEPSPENPYAYRFTHDLVRESVAGTISPPQAARLHLRIGDVLEPTVVQDETVAERAAHHLWSAGPIAEPARTVATLIRAARSAAGKAACDTAARHLRKASRVARTAGLADLELSALSLLTTVDGMREGYFGAAQQPLERAEQLARHLGRNGTPPTFSSLAGWPTPKASNSTVTVAALAGDPPWASRAARRGIAVDPDFSFGNFGGYQRLARCWARAVTGQDPTGAAVEAEGIIAAVLAEPPRSGLATWYGLLAEMWLVADKLDEAAAALDRADSILDIHGERYAEGLLLLLRAQVMKARGRPLPRVRAVAERARALSVEREAHLFAQRAETCWPSCIRMIGS